jgi:hypothetical protein
MSFFGELWKAIRYIIAIILVLIALFIITMLIYTLLTVAWAEILWGNVVIAIIAAVAAVTAAIMISPEAVEDVALAWGQATDWISERAGEVLDIIPDAAQNALTGSPLLLIAAGVALFSFMGGGKSEKVIIDVPRGVTA